MVWILTTAGHRRLPWSMFSFAWLTWHRIRSSRWRHKCQEATLLIVLARQHRPQASLHEAPTLATIAVLGESCVDRQTSERHTLHNELHVRTMCITQSLSILACPAVSCTDLPNLPSCCTHTKWPEQNCGAGNGATRSPWPPNPDTGPTTRPLSEYLRTG